MESKYTVVRVPTSQGDTTVRLSNAEYMAVCKWASLEGMTVQSWLSYQRVEYAKSYPRGSSEYSFAQWLRDELLSEFIFYINING